MAKKSKPIEESLVKPIKNELIDRPSLPDEIMSKEMEILNIKQDIIKTKLIIDEIELDVSQKIINLVDENNKPVYSNEAKRNIAIQEALKTNSYYIEMKDKVSRLEYDVKKLDIYVRYLDRLFQLELKK